MQSSLHGTVFVHQRTRLCPNGARRGFTLMEAMITVAVIGLLAAVLVPVLNSAGKSANSVACMANLRDLTSACRAYISDNHGKFPSTSLYNPSNHSKPGVLEYLEGGRTNKAYRCPSLKNYPFSAAYILPGTQLKGCTYTASLATSSNENGGSYTLNFLNRVQKAAQTAWIMDGTWSGSYFDSVIGPNALQPAIGRMQFPHSRRQNIIFVDGHVEALNHEEIPTEPTATFWTGL